MSTKSFQSLEILPRGNITMIRLSVFCVFFLTLYVCLAQEVCYPPCTCNIKSGWSGLYYIKTIRSSTFQNCNAQHLNEIPNPIHQSIVILQLNKNRITKLEITGNPRQMEVLTVNENLLNNVGIFEAQELLYLHLNQNKFTRIPVTSSSVQYLDLDLNDIDADPDNNLLYYTNLKRIDMKYNKLERLPQMPETILEAGFGSNRITFIEEKILSNCPNLKKLFLSSNLIFKIFLPQAIYLSKIDTLDLNNNPLVVDNAAKEWCKKQETNDLCRKYK